MDADERPALLADEATRIIRDIPGRELTKLTKFTLCRLDVRLRTWFSQIVEGAKMKKLAICVVASLLLGACATKYGEMGLSGGVKTEQITSDVWRVVARGNGYTQASRVQDFVLLKSAELTLAQGGTHFVVAGSQDQASVGVITTPGTATVNRIGNTSFISTSPGYSETVVKPGQDAYVRVIKVPTGHQPPAGSFNAAEIDRIVGARLRAEQ